MVSEKDQISYSDGMFLNNPILISFTMTKPRELRKQAIVHHVSMAISSNEGTHPIQIQKLIPRTATE